MREMYIVAAMLLLFSPVSAQISVEVQAGITPDNPLWAVDKVLEKLKLALTFDKAKKVEKRIQFAEERLAEAQEMVAKGKAEHAVKALEEQERLITEAQEEAAEADDIRGIDRAIQAIEEHKARMEERKQMVLNTLPEDSPAREHVEKAFVRIEERASATVEHLEEVKAKKSERVKAALAIIEAETGIDAEAEYERLMTEGRVSEAAIQQAIEYANRRLEESNVDLSNLEGKTIQVNILRDGVATQSIYITVQNGKIVETSTAVSVDHTLNLEAEDIPEIIEKAQEGDTKWLLTKLGKACGTDCVGIAKSLITTTKVSVETEHSKTEVEHTTETDTGGILSKITGGRIGR